MDPVSAGIGAGASLLQGLFGAASQKKAQARQEAAQKEMAGMQQQAQALSSSDIAKRQAMQNLVGSFGKALGV